MRPPGNPPDELTMALLAGQVDPRDNPEAALAAIKARKPFTPTVADIERMSNVLLFTPPTKPGKRGVKPYIARQALLRRLGPYQRWKGLAERNRAKGWLHDEQYMAVLAKVIDSPRVKRHNRAAEVVRRMVKCGRWPVPTVQTVRSHLAAFYKVQNARAGA